ncbi:NAD(P)/FAD-dependent oxidoreductase [Glycomyces sp. TRM65418]|uniref:phytoene desaturase family protein n=1 Tax=Glycomyces sp. TRM65418 TaxID=2867006 RepID=UPI001CE67C30|nr:NAD(P)/FAD-dependent oxidoreductase [Glycomyces sp. TRM65418]MCC3763371.1 NAD(P)/FAD-dependent oxidoreductase [Glycomyces sp. TRM65418]QZD57362.1 NAD(P)/FAD-dependent oxidoreductase [Glycomyces sp. TRM65418]
MASETETVDAVVIGAGPNGLVAANVLAQAGWEVLVLEAAPEPGGAVRTTEIAPGFLSDRCSAFYPLGAASPVIRDLGLEQHGLRWRRAPQVLAHPLPDGRTALLSRDIGRTARSLEAFASGDGDAWIAEFDLWRRVREPLLEAMLRPFPPVRAGAGLLRALGPADALRFARTLALPARRFGDERFAGEGARALVAGNAMHSGLGPDQAGSALFGWLLSMVGQDLGFPVPEGGAGQLTAALLSRLESLGGRVQCGRPVAKVLHARGVAVGVRDGEGTPVKARRAVLADVTAPHLYGDLIGVEHLPRRFASDLARFEWDQATVKVDWALDAPVPWADETVAEAGTVHLGGGLDELSMLSARFAVGREPKRPFVLMGQMTTTDPTRSPSGTESLWAYTRLPRGLDWNDDRTRRLTDRIERAVQRYAPGFKDHITARVVSGPRDLEGLDRNLDEGAINGGVAAVHQQLVFRPVPGLARADTPLDRLYLAGASAHPGGAVHGAAGANAARAALTRNGCAGGLYRAAIGGLHQRLYGED